MRPDFIYVKSDKGCPHPEKKGHTITSPEMVQNTITVRTYLRDGSLQLAERNAKPKPKKEKGE